MPEINIRTVCAACNAELESDNTPGHRGSGGDVRLIVEVCKQCLDKAHVEERKKSLRLDAVIAKAKKIASEARGIGSMWGRANVHAAKGREAAAEEILEIAKGEK